MHCKAFLTLLSFTVGLHRRSLMTELLRNRMKLNKWTCGLAALGLIQLPASVRAEEKMNEVWTALSSTTISGYVNTSMQWNLGTGNGSVPTYIYNTSSKQDGFNLNVVDLTIEKALDEDQWAAGYKVQLWVGPDAVTYSTLIDGGFDVSSLAVKQAYAALRVPVGNGLDFKVGVFDGLLGYESHDAGLNPNYTRAYGLALTPHTHTGVQMSYQFSPLISAAVAIANTAGPQINAKSNPPKAESFKAYTGALALVAPEDWGFIGGSTLYAGGLSGLNTSSAWDQTSWYVGTTLHTPLSSLKIGASYSYLGTTGEFQGDDHYADALALYASFQATEKLSLHVRGEYAWTDSPIFGGFVDLDAITPGVQVNGRGNSEIFALTGTIQYDLWKNVISRLEVRWDHLAGDGEMTPYGGSIFTTGGGSAGEPGAKRNNVLIAANLIYQF
jgi:hypothetical protein